MATRRIMTLGSMLIALGACHSNLNNIGKESDPTRFYTLTDTAQRSGEDVQPGLIIGIGPVTVADYLDRSHIVIRTSSTQLELGEFDRWASKLDKEITRVITANLSRLLGTGQIVQYPWGAKLRPEIQAEIAVERFEYGNDGKVHLVASWQVFHADGHTPAAFRRSTFEADANKDYQSITEALSKLVTQLSEEIAVSIHGMGRRFA